MVRLAKTPVRAAKARIVRRSAPAASTIEKRYTAIVCGDGRILPITERIGRRVLRVIDPEGREGRALLMSGDVTFWSPEGKIFPHLPADRLLRQMKSDLRSRLSEHPRDRRWEAHLREVARSLARSRDRISH